MSQKGTRFCNHNLFVIIFLLLALITHALGAENIYTHHLTGENCYAKSVSRAIYRKTFQRGSDDPNLEDWDFDEEDSDLRISDFDDSNSDDISPWEPAPWDSEERSVNTWL